MHKQETINALAALVVAAENAQEQPTYREPQVFELGEAKDLMRHNITGRLRDGHSGGWWVWGS